MGAPLGSGIGYLDPSNRICPVCVAKDGEIKRLREYVMDIVSAMHDAADEIDRLQAIVDKFSWTVDGVPVTLGMILWVPGRGVWDDKLWKIKVTAIDSNGYVSTIIGGRPQYWHVSECFSTCKATEEAGFSTCDPCEGLSRKAVKAKKED